MFLLAVGIALPAGAQTTNSGVGLGPSQQVAQPLEAQTGVAPTVEHLLGDPGGVRSRLESHGIFLLLDAVTEFAGNISGGTRRGATFANQVGFEADIDWQRLAGIDGLSTHVVIVNRSGSSDSHLFGDNLEPVQEIYGSGGDTAVHLVSAYAQETLLNRRIDVAAGRMNVENDFASSPLYCNYMNNTLCGDPKALPGGDVGHSAYPDAAWGARLRVRPTGKTYVQAGVYQVNQAIYTYPAFRSGFKFDGSRDSGVYVPVEFAYEPLIGTDKLPGHYKIGFGYDSSGTFTPFSAALNSIVPAPHHTGNTQGWVLVDQMVRRQGAGDIDGIIALAGFIHNDPSNSSYAEEYFVGVLDRAFWPKRPQDTIGIQFSYNTVSGALGKVQAQEMELGIPISNNATAPQSREMVLELNYDLHVTTGVNVQPEFQYIIHPNAQANIHNATVLGFKAHVEF
ncbi:carbohydrate porin [Acidisphaera sp. L21]|uniref:carbohydrate porin n=1 Tax=Acidisphaera sp. L21 TaxID=1641851 RepID=UPI00131A966B|nr:carbohydrate porin [Acidisphaera sp. L21]